MRTSLRFLVPIASGLLLGISCSGGGGGGGGGGAKFNVTSMSASQGVIWPINRAFEFTFSFPVDFSTVSGNTIRIVSDSGIPATGTYAFKRLDTDGDGNFETVDEHTVLFRPNCPTQADFSDAGLLPGGEPYTITVIGTNRGTTNTVRSQDGRLLAETQTIRFTTPNSFDPAVVFLDTTPGPPVPIVRKQGSLDENGVSYVEVGGNSDPDTRIYFEFDPATQTYSAVPGPLAPDQVPLNLYSDPDARAAVVIEFNQPVGTSDTNISERRLRLEFQDAGGTWIPIETRVQLVANCTETGATVRLEPVGLLPAGSNLRAVMRTGFSDLVGQTAIVQADAFAVAPTTVLDYQSLNDPGGGADEFIESFDFGGDDFASFEDTQAVFDSPIADWGGGKLGAAFDFGGTGGPGGNFDWVIRSGQVLVFDTIATDIVGGPNGVPTRIQQSRGGLVDVRNLIINQGGVLKVQGPNPMILNATGEVRIEGQLDLSGFNAKDVATLNTGHQPETGGAGAAGGGPGGDASEVTNNSTPRGGRGGGPFGERETGGQGGESGYAAPSAGKDSRRPGGGGGGRFAADYPTDPKAVGLEAEDGYPGHENSRGAETKSKPALGGRSGLGPFKDNLATNDFFGVLPTLEPDGMGGFRISGLIRGELSKIWAGYGGGGGGDALPSVRFPTPRWSAGSDEKGGGGGGGGGACRIRALGQIVFGRVGLILSNGGEGGTGENTNFLDHVGGTGGSGSGGHVILESAVGVDFVDGDPLETSADSNVHVIARGGRTAVGSKLPRDNIPCGVSHGGSGGPGVIQIHVPTLNPPSSDPTKTDILISTEFEMNPNSNGLLYPYTRPPAYQLIPTFGARSKARSTWIALGGADQDPAGGKDLVRFLFAGTDRMAGPTAGQIRRSGNTVADLPSILGPVGFPSAEVELLADEVTFRISGSALEPLRNPSGVLPLDMYLRTPELLREFKLHVDEAANPAVAFDFDVVDASYDDATATLEFTVFSAAGTVIDLTENEPGFEITLIPRFFRVATGGLPDILPANSYVRISFDATGADAQGLPDAENLLVEDAFDINEFNSLMPGDLRFFRFQVEFNLDATGVGISPDTKPVELEFLRIPFIF